VTDILSIVAVVLLIAAGVLLLMLLKEGITSPMRLLPSDAFEKAPGTYRSVGSERKWPGAETNWARRAREQRQELTGSPSRPAVIPWYNE